MNTQYIEQPLSTVIRVQKIISLHYFEFTKDFSYEGERHPFWEFVLIDSGALEVIAGDKVVCLKKDEIIFHKPNEFHNVICNNEAAPNVIILSFDAVGTGMRFFQNRVLHVTGEQKTLLGEIVKEGMNAFQGPFDVPFNPRMRKNDHALFGAQQRLKNLIELLLIDFVRSNQDRQANQEVNLSPNSVAYGAVQKAFSYFERNLFASVSLDDLSHELNLSKSTVKQMFKTFVGKPPIQYYIDLKIAEAKRLIREEKQSMTEISVKLGFSSVHYFSRCFKKVTGLSPTGYAKTVKAKFESL